MNKFAIDFKVPVGTPVRAAAAGKVTYVKEDIIGSTRSAGRSGNRIAILSDQGYAVIYCHLGHDGAVVSVGDIVKAGDLVGYSGSTGSAVQPHLHINVLRKTRFGDSTPWEFASHGVAKKGESLQSRNHPLVARIEFVEQVSALYDFCVALDVREALLSEVHELRKEKPTRRAARRAQEDDTPKGPQEAYTKKRRSFLQRHLIDASAAVKRFKKKRTSVSMRKCVGDIFLGSRDFEGVAGAEEFGRSHRRLIRHPWYKEAVEKLKPELQIRESLKAAIRVDLAARVVHLAGSVADWRRVAECYRVVVANIKSPKRKKLILARIEQLERVQPTTTK